MSWRSSLAAIAAVALAIRLIYLLEMRGTPFFGVTIGDAKAYDAWALQIAGGQWLGGEIFYQTPLYPYALAVVFSVFGHDLFVVRLLQALLGSASCVILAVAGRRFFNERAGLIAGLLLAIYPPAVFFDGLIQKASLDLFFMTTLAALVGGYQLRPDWRWLAAAGLTLGLFSLNRENARVLYPILVVWLLAGDSQWPFRERARRAALLTAFALLVLLPVGLRNYAVGGEFLISTSQLGPNFYIGNHRGARGSYEALVPGRGDALFERGDAKQLAESAAGRSLSPAEVSDYWLRRGLEYIREEPVDWIRLIGRKLMLTFGAAEVVDTESLEVYAENSRVLRVFAWLHFGVVLPLALFGAWLSRNDWRRLMILHGLWIVTAIAVALFFVLARYRYPLVPILLLFAAEALARLPDLVRHPPRVWSAGAVAAVLAAVVVNQTPSATDDATYLNLGAELIHLGTGSGRPSPKHR
jgi:4-amino-4-deoxy-L-arabinose transferase-like glycosyltransferase